MCDTLSNLTEKPLLNCYIYIPITNTMEYKDEIINLRIEPSYKESLLVKAKKQKMTLAKYCREKLTKDLDT